jgi:hypothetical protein
MIFLLVSPASSPSPAGSGFAYDGTSADQRLAVNDYDVVVLDRDLPGVHGDDVCRDLVRPNRWVSQFWSSLFTPPRMRIHPSITPSKLSFSTNVPSLPGRKLEANWDGTMNGQPLGAP